MRTCFYLFSVLLINLYGCGPEQLLESQKTIPNGQWAYKDTLDFSFKVKDTSAIYNIVVDFEYADTFPNQNIYVKFHTRFPDGKRLSKPLSFDFYDPEGRPAGTCSGSSCSAHIPIQQNAFFEKAGDYTITLEQFGRQDPLTGLKSIGLSISKAGQKK